MKKITFHLACLLALSFVSSTQAALPSAPDLSAYAGKVVYLDFWASWCAPCRRSFPWMNDMLARYEADGLVIVSVNVDTERALADAFLAETPAGFPVIHDPAGSIAAAWGLMGMPSSFLIDRNGQLASRHVGFRSDSPQAYETEIRALLEQEAAR